MKLLPALFFVAAGAAWTIAIAGALTSNILPWVGFFALGNSFYCAARLYQLERLERVMFRGRGVE